jgi:hypothetical protein
MLKSNQLILGRVLKVAIVLLAAVMLFFALRKFLAEPDSISRLVQLWQSHKMWLLVVMLLLPLNWFLEAAKWKKLVAVSEPITWKQAWSAVLAGLAIGSATPNRVGEFAGRIFQLKSTPLADGIMYSLVSSLMQVMVTIAFGFIGLMLTDPDQYMHSNKAFLWLAAVGGAMSIGVAFMKNPRTRFAKYFTALNTLDGSVARYVLFMAFVRYLVYALQFFIMLKLCGVEAAHTQLALAIAVNYLIVTIVPSVMFSELLVRGTVASGVIGSLCGNPGGAALAAVLIWLINVALPAAAGLFFVKNITFFRKQ